MSADRAVAAPARAAPAYLRSLVRPSASGVRPAPAATTEAATDPFADAMEPPQSQPPAAAPEPIRPEAKTETPPTKIDALAKPAHPATAPRPDQEPPPAATSANGNSSAMPSLDQVLRWVAEPAAPKPASRPDPAVQPPTRPTPPAVLVVHAAPQRPEPPTAPLVIRPEPAPIEAPARRQARAASTTLAPSSRVQHPHAIQPETSTPTAAHPPAPIKTNTAPHNPAVRTRKAELAAPVAPRADPLTPHLDLRIGTVSLTVQAPPPAPQQPAPPVAAATAAPATTPTPTGLRFSASRHYLRWS